MLQLWRFGRGCSTTWIWILWSCVPRATTWEFGANCCKVYKFGGCSSTLADMWFDVDSKYGDLRTPKLVSCKHHPTSWMWDRHCVDIHCHRSCGRRKLVGSSVQSRASRTRRSQEDEHMYSECDPVHQQLGYCSPRCQIGKYSCRKCAVRSTGCKVVRL